jgi:Trp operon repressor
MVAGKRSFAFITKNVFGAPKALVRLMKNMEKEGMFLKYSSILNSPQEAEEIGKRLHIIK